jgi:hypothetical protein
MATFGIEGIRHFAALRASGTIRSTTAGDLTYVFNICDGLRRLAQRRRTHTGILLGRE